MTRASGTVKFFNDARGFGFLKPDGGGLDIFVHRVDLAEACRIGPDLTLKEGQGVSFEIVEGPKGPKAKAVTIREGQHALAT